VASTYISLPAPSITATIIGTANVNVVSSVLPTGASTSALQTSGNASLVSIDSKLTSPLSVTGPLTDAQLRATAVPISASALPLPSGAATEATLLSIDTKLTSPLSVTFTNSTIAVTQSTSPWAISAASLPLPTGAATEATLLSIDTKLTNPLPISGTVTANLGTLNGAATSTLQTSGNASLVSIDSKLTSPLTVTGTVAFSNTTIAVTNAGTFAVQATQAGTWNIGTLSTITNPVAVTGTFFQATQPVSIATMPTTPVTGPLTDAELRATPVPISGTVAISGTIPISGTVTANQGTSPWVVSAASLPLPTGASTSALQTSGNASLVSIDSKLTSPLTVTGPLTDTQLRATPVPISGTVAFSNTTIAVTQSTSPWVISGSVTANAGTNLNTSLLALESGGNLATIKTNTDNLALAQASTTSGQKGNLPLGAVTTDAPTYTTAQSNPLSLTTKGGLRTSEIRPSTSAVTSVAGSATSVTLLASNINRIHAFLFNDSNAVAYVKLGATASTSSYTLQLAKNAFYELPEPAYTGIIDCIWGSAAGNMRITEIT
jgi:hypothetical protein